MPSDRYNMMENETESSSLVGVSMSHQQRRKMLKRRQIMFVVVVVVVAAAVVAAVIATQGNDKAGSRQPSSNAFASKVKVEDVHTHLQQFYNISQQFNNTRSAWLGGFNKSVEYVVSQLNTSDYYDVKVQPFRVDHFRELNTPSLLVSFDSHGQVKHSNIMTMRFSNTGNVTAPVKDAHEGCVASDFGVMTGHIALIVRGNCTYYEKAKLALNAGAAGVIFSNSADYPITPTNGRVRGGEDNAQYVDLPMIGIAYDYYNTLSTVLAAGVVVEASMTTHGVLTYQESANIIAEMKNGNNDSVVVVGSHLDSVEAGPGINDNGSGSAVNLQIALEMMKNNINPVNKVRFLWFGAEELGLLGSYHYVDDLKANDPETLANISCMFNFDMVGSPNFIRGVYDGASATNKHAANGSVIIQHEFEKRFDELGLAWQLTPFNERSDYAPFTISGIPAGGLFTGAEGPIGGKTEEERRKYGGIASVAYDTCYHEACDTIDNINMEVLENMADAAAYVVYDFASKENVRQFLYPNATTLAA